MLIYYRGGYTWAGGRIITDEILAEGKGGYYARVDGVVEVPREYKLVTINKKLCYGPSMSNPASHIPKLLYTFMKGTC